MRMHLCYFSLVLCWLSSAAATAEDHPSRHVYHPKTGSITVGANLATIVIPEQMEWLESTDARYLLEDVYKNPPDPAVLGLVRPQSEDQDWVAVVTWDDEGHVEDADAAKTDYAALLSQMKAGAEESNPERAKHGYSTYKILGWAEPPHYDATLKKLYWAKSALFADEKAPTLNYCVRILGARGVLELNLIDSVSNLPKVAPAAQHILATTTLNAGNRYEDFKPGIDPVKAGGIAGLIAGGLIAKKLGILAMIGLGFVKFFKFLVIPFALLGGWLWKWFQNRRA